MSQKIIEVGARVYVAIFMFIYGFSKVMGHQFYRKGALPEDVANVTLSNASNFDLAWTFMGYSYWYMLFIGLAECIGAVMILFEKTKLMGALLLLTVLINVIVFDILFLDKYGALASAIIYTLLLCIVLWINRQRLLSAWKALLPSSSTKLFKIKNWQEILMVLGFIIVVFVINQTLVENIGHGRG